MKKILAAVMTVVAFMSMLSSCSDSTKEEKKTAAPAKKTAVAPEETLPNYRYVDLDTLLSKYNLAKDYNEEIIRMQNSMEQEIKRHESSIQNMATQMQNKMQNNTYLTRESYEADEKKLAGLQQNAQKSVGALQQNFATKAEKAQATVNDSINAFIEEYNKKHGYDAIFFKAAALHFNPALDITDEIVEGLNARYNKVKK
ncbi:MAG: OmpH family outer membrane protein [Bacteroides sp.]|nr:OmpH family outer membrane protein [Bacteroides sp.]